MIREEVLSNWDGLKEKILGLLDNRETDQIIKEQMIERYEKKLQERNIFITKLEEEIKYYKKGSGSGPTFEDIY